MQRESWRPVVSGTVGREAEAEQEAIIREEERSTDAWERARSTRLSVDDVALHNDFAALVGRGRQLTITLAELVVATREIRAIAMFARQRAVRTRDASELIRARRRSDALVSPK